MNNKQPIPKFIYAETQNKPISSITTIKYETKQNVMTESAKIIKRIDGMENRITTTEKGLTEKMDEILECVKFIKDKLSQYDIESEGEDNTDEETLEQFLEEDEKEKQENEESKQ